MCVYSFSVDEFSVNGVPKLWTETVNIPPANDVISSNLQLLLDSDVRFLK